MTVKQRLKRMIEAIPDDAGIDEAIDRLYLLLKIEEGIAQADAGQTVSHDEARKRMSKWLRK